MYAVTNDSGYYSHMDVWLRITITTILATLNSAVQLQCLQNRPTYFQHCFA